MVVKSKEERGHLKVLAEMFEIFKEHKLRLKAAKYAFGVSSGKFLGCLVTWQGIKAISKWIITIKDLESPRTTNEILKLTRMVATLNHFISKSSDKCCSFYQLFRTNPKFVGGERE